MLAWCFHQMSVQIPDLFHTSALRSLSSSWAALPSDHRTSVCLRSTSICKHCVLLVSSVGSEGTRGRQHSQMVARIQWKHTSRQYAQVAPHRAHLLPRHVLPLTRPKYGIHIRIIVIFQYTIPAIGSFSALCSQSVLCTLCESRYAFVHVVRMSLHV